MQIANGNLRSRKQNTKAQMKFKVNELRVKAKKKNNNNSLTIQEAER